MQHAEETGGAPAEVLRVGGQPLDRSGRGLEQRAVADARMRAQASAQPLGHGEGEHEVVGGKLAPELARQPRVRLVPLAARTVTVAAAARQLVGGATALALIEDRPGRLATASADRLDQLGMGMRTRLAEARQVGRAVDAEDLLDAAHLTSSSITVSISA